MRRDATIHGDKRVWECLQLLDEVHLPSASYLDRQEDLTPSMRRTVASWMVEVCDEERCHEDVLVTSVNYLDRVLTHIPPIRRQRLQLYAAACMFIASKFKDTSPISAQLLAMYTDWSITTGQLLECELIILNALKWELSCVGPYNFLDQLLFRLSFQVLDLDLVTLRRHAAILIVMCAVEPQFSVCPPSLVSSACLCAAASGLLGATWCKKTKLHTILHQLTSIDKDTLRHHQEQIEEMVKVNIRQRELASQSGDQPCSDDEDAFSKSRSSAPRQPSTPTDVLDIKLVS